jgi:hypothetical protein
VKFEILERLHGLALAGTGKSGHHHEAHERQRIPPELVHMKLFSPEKANALIPVLEPLIVELWGKRRELAIRLLESDPALRASRSSGTSVTNPERRTEARRNTELKAEIVRIINRIEAYGCLMKDIDLGLLDFPALRDGRPIYLCWKSGEDALTHWHATDENFGDRKAL